MNFKKYLHNPPHLFVPNTKYFITARIYNKLHLLKTKESKKQLFNILGKGFLKRKWIIEDWVILNNHYHLMVDSGENSDELPDIIKEIHKFSALWIKKNVSDAKHINKIWHNYWDTCITYERSYFARLNYIWNNPVKHGYIERPEDWEFGSYRERFEREKEYLARINKNYPSDKVKIYDDY
jgi:putative transposase